MKKLHILLVDDSEHDAFLIKEALEEQEFLSNFSHVINGQEAINFLQKLSPFENVETPDLILMDINMPVMDGHESLKRIKEMDAFKDIPILMLSTSSRKEDIIRAYRGQSSSYIVKPDDIYDLENLAQALKTYWSNIVKLPPRE
ncbi:response regulator [Mongoliitalea daihaiensis]|uniref:response regulator n=1 Tax=Mongoliitalea daihaiensis TaxID=2782006 RepID=UPI001F3211FC|nr:response regulator [Mongoliitalea daihaiensis]UJP65958.1 response regulator [Mongoliitalea daihaiensis]